MEVVTWVKISWYIYEDGIPVSQQKIDPEHRIDIPRHMLERWRWLIIWRSNKYKYLNPRKLVHTVYSFYDKKTGIDTGYESIYMKYISAKAQVTKVRNVISKYIALQKSTLFGDSIESDSIYIQLNEKLKVKQNLLHEIKMQLDEQIKITT